MKYREYIKELQAELGQRATGIIDNNTIKALDKEIYTSDFDKNYPNLPIEEIRNIATDYIVRSAGSDLLNSIVTEAVPAFKVGGKFNDGGRISGKELAQKIASDPELMRKMYSAFLSAGNRKDSKISEKRFEKGLEDIARGGMYYGIVDGNVQVTADRAGKYRPKIKGNSAAGLPVRNSLLGISSQNERGLADRVFTGGENKVQDVLLGLMSEDVLPVFGGSNEVVEDDVENNVEEVSDDCLDSYIDIIRQFKQQGLNKSSDESIASFYSQLVTAYQEGDCTDSSKILRRANIILTEFEGGGSSEEEVKPDPSEDNVDPGGGGRGRGAVFSNDCLEQQMQIASAFETHLNSDIPQETKQKIKVEYDKFLKSSYKPSAKRFDGICGDGTANAAAFLSSLGEIGEDENTDEKWSCEKSVHQLLNDKSLQDRLGKDKDYILSRFAKQVKDGHIDCVYYGGILEKYLKRKTVNEDNTTEETTVENVESDDSMNPYLIGAAGTALGALGFTNKGRKMVKGAKDAVINKTGKVLNQVKNKFSAIKDKYSKKSKTVVDEDEAIAATDQSSKTLTGKDKAIADSEEMDLALNNQTSTGSLSSVPPLRTKTKLQTNEANQKTRKAYDMLEAKRKKAASISSARFGGKLFNQGGTFNVEGVSYKDENGKMFIDIDGEWIQMDEEDANFVRENKELKEEAGFEIPEWVPFAGKKEGRKLGTLDYLLEGAGFVPGLGGVTEAIDGAFDLYDEYQKGDLGWDDVARNAGEIGVGALVGNAVGKGLTKGYKYIKDLFMRDGGVVKAVKEKMIERELNNSVSLYFKNGGTLSRIMTKKKS